MKRILIIQVIILLGSFSLSGQAVQQDLKREVTLFNPYKPALADFRKHSTLPVLDDTAKVKPDFRYNISVRPVIPEYAVSPIKAAAIQPDPLEKLYKSYINLGVGNYLTPLAELSITNERSKKGAIGIYARHFSMNGKIRLENDKKVFAGYMDNDLSLFGKKFFSKNILEGNVGLSQKIRHAYGYDTNITGYDPDPKDVRTIYDNVGAEMKFASINPDSSSLFYDFNARYDFFYNEKNHYQHNAELDGLITKPVKDFYAGSAFDFDFILPADSIYSGSGYVASVNPFVKKSSSQWSFRLGAQLLLDKNMTDKPVFHAYPDISFAFSVVPSYIGFFAELGGELEKNKPRDIITENPFIIGNGKLFRLRHTDKALIVKAGLKGNNGIGGNYLLSASYSVINDLILYTNFVFPDSLNYPEMGNHFIPVYDNANLLAIHGEMNGRITDKIGYAGIANYYIYTMSALDFAWGKPDWDAKLGLKYNLRDKILINLDVAALGQRKLVASRINALPPATSTIFTMPAYVNFNLGAEYRYTKILSFWFRLNNISFSRFYEYAYYPAQRFIGLVGFTYSL